MTRLQRSRPLRWLCTLATVAALVVVLFPVYAVVVGSFESTTTLFSGNYYWLPHAPTLDNFRTVIQAQSGNVLTSLIVGVGTALLALVVAVPAAYALAKYRLRVTVVIVSALLVAQIVPSIVLATSLFIIFHWVHLVNTYPGPDSRRRHLRHPLCHPRAAGLLLQPAQRGHAGREGRRGHRMADLPAHRGATGTFGRDNRGGVRLPERLGGLHIRPDRPQRHHHRSPSLWGSTPTSAITRPIGAR